MEKVAGAPDNEDTGSLDNNTNFDWCRTNVIEVEGQNNSVPADRFYQQSHYFIDTLKGEFCKQEEGDWFRFAEPISQLQPKELPIILNTEGESSREKEQDTAEGSPAQPKKQPVKWSGHEHRRFLRAVKLYGKDWPSIQQYVGTRNAKQVRSHAQKFLQQLVRLLSDGRSIEKISLMEAQYFYGVLSQKQHRCTLLRMRKVQKALEKPIFAIEKVDRRARQREEEQHQTANQPGDVVAEVAVTPDDEDMNSVYSKWRVDQDEVALKSIELREVGGAQCFSFKSVLKKLNGSQDSGEFLVFDITDGFTQYNDSISRSPERDQTYVYYTQLMLEQLPDIAADDEDPLIIATVGEGGPEFDFLEDFNSETLINMVYELHLYNLVERCPNLCKWSMKWMGQLVDEYGPEVLGYYNYSEQQSSMLDYMYSLPKEELREIMEKGEFRLRYVYKGGLKDGYTLSNDDQSNQYN